MAKAHKTRAGDGGTAVDAPVASPLTRGLRVLNVLTAVPPLASALAVLGSNLLDPAYRTHYRDAPWFVVLYVAFYVWIIVAFLSARRVRMAQALAVAKAIGAYAFLI